jgi:hypothetical protein
MNDPRKAFEAIMRTNGHTNFTQNKSGGYVVPSLHTRWKYFLLGWEMRGLQ